MRRTCVVPLLNLPLVAFGLNISKVENPPAVEPGIATLAVSMTQPAHDPFFGVWELDPNTLDYQQGRPGRRATYTIEPVADGLRFILDADDADGKSMHHTYGGKLDGEDIPIPNTPLSLALRMPDERTIESILKKEGQVIDRWTRTVQPDGQTMVITQHGLGSNGQAFRNNGTYRRVR